MMVLCSRSGKYACTKDCGVAPHSSAGGRIWDILLAGGPHVAQPECAQSLTACPIHSQTPYMYVYLYMYFSFSLRTCWTILRSCNAWNSSWLLTCRGGTAIIATSSNFWSPLSRRPSSTRWRIENGTLGSTIICFTLCVRSLLFLLVISRFEEGLTPGGIRVDRSCHDCIVNARTFTHTNPRIPERPSHIGNVDVFMTLLYHQVFA